MGTYYVVACDATREFIEPGNIDDLGMKRRSIAHPEHPLGQLVIFALTGIWAGMRVRAVGDDITMDADTVKEYRDITKQIIKEYNAEYKTQLKFTGRF